jgi:rare lipoprotein A
MLILICGTACSHRTSARLPAAPKIGATETGIASWYGVPYHGRRTASGEIYNMEAMTAAHRTLIFGTWLRVDNLDNGKRTEVRVTDRGPFVKNRVLDLSHAAARQIDMLSAGSARVRLTVIRAPSSSKTAAPPHSSDTRFGVQVGAFPDRSRADHLRRDLEVRFGKALNVRRDGSPPMWRVIVGNEHSLEAAEEYAARLRREFPNAAVVRLDDPR